MNQPIHMKTKQYLQYIFCCGLLLLWNCYPVTAQKGFNAGINAGYNMSFMIDRVKFGDVPYNLKLKTGPSFGIAAGYNYNNLYGIEVEGNYIDLGSRFSIPTDNGHYTKTYYVSYYQVPVLFKFVGGDYLTRFSSMAGPVFGFMNMARMTSDSVSNSDVRSNFKSTDLGILVSAGGDITLVNNLYINIAVRLYYGFNTINTVPNLVMKRTTNDNLNNTYIGLNLGLYNLFVKPKPAKAPDW
jgi:hypothetical protein